MEKYKFTGETKTVDGVTLKRIVVVTAFGNVGVLGATRINGRDF